MLANQRIIAFWLVLSINISSLTSCSYSIKKHTSFKKHLTPSFNYILIKQNDNNQSEYHNQGQYNDYVKLVVNFLTEMLAYDYGNKQTKLMTFLATDYFRKNQLDHHDFIVNSFSPKHFKILAVNQYYVCAIIYDLQYQWAHLLLFKMVRTEGQIFIYPRKTNYKNYLDPWCDEIRNIGNSTDDYIFQKENVILKIINKEVPINK